MPTPMMQRYMECKRENPGTLLLFRMGDFYELFFDDAKLGAKVLGLTLTSREKNSDNPVPMAGFPYHALDGYLQKLINAGLRVSVCEQVEDPKTAKGMVRREVVRVVTPGTLTDDTLLDPRESNYLACVFPARERAGVAWLELSTGRFLTCEVAARDVLDELARIHPAECLLPEESSEREVIAQLNGTVLSDRPAWHFNRDNCRKTLLDHFSTTTLEGFDLEDDTAAITAAGALLEYVQETQKASLAHIARIEPFRRGRTLILDESTRRSLEITRTLREGKREGTLIAVIDETVTPMGARLLAEWLHHPLTDIPAIAARHEAVEEFADGGALRTDVRALLDSAYDMERLVSRIATGRASPRDLGSLSRTLELLPGLKAKLSGRSSVLVQRLEARIDLCEELRTELEETLVDDPPQQITEGGIIRAGFHTELDELRELARGGKAWIARYQASQIERTGIPNLKVGFNKVFGYYLEVTAAHRDKVPEDFTRKQTLKNAERFITPELKEYEDKVLRAEERGLELEQQLFQQLRGRVAKECRRLQQTAEVLAATDVLSSLAELAVKQNYARPEMCDESLLEISDGRHPVLDRLQPTGEFVPNDVRIECIAREGDDMAARSQVQLITGPNMAGKSTYIRQAALLTLLAQMGSFVPAKTARIGVADRIFARVGASDELGKGQSTFMVEMTETARILNSATPRSLVILDEIGRGTSTYDGLSLAWAVTEYLHENIGCRSLFATHYHELTALAETLERCVNWNVAVREAGDRVVFLHKIVPGAADRSYGIHVAKLAGVPRGVIERASTILAGFEEADAIAGEPGKRSITPRLQMSLFAEQHPVIDELREIDPDRLTPLEALTILCRLRDEIA